MTSTFLKAGLFGALCGKVTCSSALLSFDAFIQTHDRSYSNGSVEYETRRDLYEQRLNVYAAHNANPDRLWTAGVNRLWDWTEAELKTLRGWDGTARPARASGGTRGIQRQHALLQTAESEDKSLPEEKDWSNLAMASHLRQQSACGSCWAVAVSSVLEGHAEISGKPRTFSAQQIVDCTPNPKHCGGDGGCKGATAELGMEWVLHNDIADEATVPYTATDGECNVGSSKSGTSFLGLKKGSKNGFGMMGWETLASNEVAPLKRALAERGPVAVSVAAREWFAYNDGIFNSCSKDCVIDHAVTAIGYGSSEGKGFWKIQNSWGSSWGENGHMRLYRHGDDESWCGMDDDPQKGVACQGETQPVKVCGMCGVLYDSVVPHF